MYPKGPKEMTATLVRIVSVLAAMVLLPTMTACDGRGDAGVLHRGSIPLTDLELKSEMQEELFALATNRDGWFLASDMTTEALEGLYDSWSLICRNETSLADYKGLVFEVVRPWFLETITMDLKDAQEADRYYKLKSWNSPWAYVEQTWKIGNKIVWGPQVQLFIIESGEWRYHDC